MAKATPKPIRAESRRARCLRPGIKYATKKQPRSKAKKITLNLPLLSMCGVGRASRCAPASHRARRISLQSSVREELRCLRAGVVGVDRAPLVAGSATSQGAGRGATGPGSFLTASRKPRACLLALNLCNVDAPFLSSLFRSASRRVHPGLARVVLAPVISPGFAEEQ